MKIYIVSGKARHGKDTICEYIKKIYEADGKKVINLSYGSYIKMYARNISNWDGQDDDKPRALLQKLGTDIREKIDANFFINRICEDIKVYSCFFDVITISDARFIDEIKIPREKFQNVINIGVIRDNYLSELSKNEQKHLTETALDGYNSYDYLVHNDSDLVSLEAKIKKIVKKVEHEY